MLNGTAFPGTFLRVSFYSYSSNNDTLLCSAAQNDSRCTSGQYSSGFTTFSVDNFMANMTRVPLLVDDGLWTYGGIGNYYRSIAPYCVVTTTVGVFSRNGWLPMAAVNFMDIAITTRATGTPERSANNFDSNNEQTTTTIPADAADNFKGCKLLIRGIILLLFVKDFVI